jgi:hypothetical protein
MKTTTMTKQNNHHNHNATQQHNVTLYTNALLEIHILLLPTEIGSTKTKENLKKTIAHFVEGKCITEGYIKPNTVQLKNYSSGIIKGDKIEFNVVFECKVCNPVEGTWVNKCKVKSITKAGIHANAFDDNNNIPVTVFVIRDHFVDNKYFNSIKEDDLIDVKVIGSRFELNDPCIEVIGNLMPKTNK